MNVGDGWQEAHLGDLFQIKHGYAFKGEHFTNNGSLIVLTPGNFQAEGGLKLKGDKEKYYAATFPKDFLLTVGEMLVVMTDLIQNAPILGSPAIIPENGRYLHNQRLGKITDVKTKTISKAFLYHLLNYHEVRSQIRGSATGSTVRHTSPSRIYEVKVSLPPLETQQQIAAILSAYDDLIENNTRRIKVLEEMAGLIYREWFVNFRFPGHEGVRMVVSELGEIPEGWEVKPIGTCIEISGGGTPSKQKPEFWEGDDAVINWFTPSDLTAAKSMFVRESGARITQLGLAKSSAKLFPAYSVMMTSRATIGVIAINTEPASTNQGFIVCVPTEQLGQYHLYFWLKENMQNIDNISSGATFKEVRRTLFRELPIVIPDEKTALSFTAAVGPIGKLIENLYSKNQNLRRTRDLLLPKLISGELSVSQLGAELPKRERVA